MNIYFVLYVPEPFATRVMDVRHAHRDTLRSSLPVEFTIAGSSGVGVLDPEQDLSKAYASIDAIAAETAPIEVEFGPVHRFPNSDVFVLTVQNPAPFFALQKRVMASGLRFLPTPFPSFLPHCTLRSRSPITEADANGLLGVRIPGRFTLDSLSVCGLDRPPVTLLHHAVLAGKS